MSEQRFKIGDRVAYDNGLGYEPRWFIGSIVGRRAGGFEIRWDDGFVDDEGIPYTESELEPAAVATA